ncbi:heavy-metal-associated domain-containing protein [Anaerolineae bacterium CFX7]|nr:heavy-metal-associated domain-containing protein [Anaerolineae bacterium CFX7]
MNTRRISFSIQGMFCARCAVDLEHALAEPDGVIGACVNYASERATVMYEPARVNPKQFVAIVKRAGFATPLEEELKMQATTVSSNEARKRWLVPWLVGLGGGAALILLYLTILSIAQSPSHALEQLSQDRLWVGLVALGFGIQVGLYAYLRLIISTMQLAGATAMTGAGTTTSTVGMIACCAHHLADFAPLVALTGATGLSGAVAFLAEWKIPFILFGLAVNAIAIWMSVRTIRRERAHLKMMETSAVKNASAVTATAPACH